jgi:hypothetical protein
MLKKITYKFLLKTRRSNSLFDSGTATLEFWTVRVITVKRARVSPKFCVYKIVVCKLPDFSNLFARSMHVDQPLKLFSQVLPVLVFVTAHFMYGK